MSDIGIANIHILTEPDDSDRRIQLAQAAQMDRLIEAHRRGEHSVGSMHRDCPLCQK